MQGHCWCVTGFPCSRLANNNLQDRSRVTQILVVACAIGNAVLHGLSWNAHFPSRAECFLWRFSCVGMVSFPVAAYFTSVWGRLIRASVYGAWRVRFWNQTRFLEEDPKSRVTLLGRPYIPPYNAIRILWRFFVISFESFKIGAKESALRLQQDHERKHYQPVDDKVKFKWTLSFYLSVTVVTGYMFCMSYFAIEAFISIRSLPDGAYDLPPLTQILPHIQHLHFFLTFFHSYWMPWENCYRIGALSDWLPHWDYD